jgi:hypothetical protein
MLYYLVTNTYQKREGCREMEKKFGSSQLSAFSGQLVSMRFE